MARTATWRGHTLAHSERTLEVDGYVYFPRDTVHMDLLQVAPKTARDLECPHGGQFYDVVGGGALSARALAAAMIESYAIPAFASGGGWRCRHWAASAE